MGAIKECAFIGGAAATPKIKPWHIPDRLTQSFIDDRAREVEKAITQVTDTLGYEIAEAAKVTPEEYALGGFGGRKSKRPSRE